MRLISTTLLLIMSFNLFAQYNDEKTSCEAKGNIWTEGKGCRVPQAVVDLRNQAKQCQGLQGEALNACTEQAAENSTSVKHNNSIHKNEGLIYAAAIITSLATGIAFIRRQKSSMKCIQPSYWLLFAGSVSALTGEVVARLKYKKQIRDISKSYANSDTNKDANSDDYSLNKQLDAFNKLIEIEKAREDAEKIRQTLYTISAVSYAGASVAAIIEAIDIVTTPAKDAKCNGISVEKISPKDINASQIDSSVAESSSFFNTNKKNIQYKLNSKLIDVEKLAFFDKSFKDYSYLKKINKNEFLEIVTRKIFDAFIPSSHAGVLGFLSKVFGTLGSKLSSIAVKTSKGIGRLFGFAPTRIGLSAVLSIGSGLLLKQAKEIRKESVDRQNELERMKNLFESTGGNSTGRCTESMRTDSNNPNCFCYLKDGTKDISKKNLVVCVENWGNSNVASGDNYNASTNTTVNSGIQTCVTKRYESDLGCKCKGNQSCLKVSSSNLNFGKGMNWAGQILNSTNAAFSSGLEGAYANLGSFEKKAATLKRTLDNMSKDEKYKGVIAKAKRLEAKILKASRNNAKKFMEKNPTAFSQIVGGASSSLEDKKVKKEKAKLVASLPKKFSSALKAKKLDSFDLDFGEGNDSGVEIVEDESANANADYKYDAVLHKNPDANIFKILSNRYMRTGVKNLFEEKVEEKAQ